LKELGIRVAVDDRINHTPGFKYNDWEIKGTPIRLEIGINELDKE
jgi:prolyl-tRNA synthetase